MIAVSVGTILQSTLSNRFIHHQFNGYCITIGIILGIILSKCGIFFKVSSAHHISHVIRIDNFYYSIRIRHQSVIEPRYLSHNYQIIQVNITDNIDSMRISLYHLQNRIEIVSCIKLWLRLRQTELCSQFDIRYKFATIAIIKRALWHLQIIDARIIQTIQMNDKAVFFLITLGQDVNIAGCFHLLFAKFI